MDRIDKNAEFQVQKLCLENFEHVNKSVRLLDSQLKLNKEKMTFFNKNSAVNITYDPEEKKNQPFTKASILQRLKAETFENVLISE